MNDSFFATVKLITGEEVLSEVFITEENDQEFVVFKDPIIIVENTTVDPAKGMAFSGLIPKKWMLYSNDDMTVVHKQHVITMSEMDKFGVEFYRKALLAAKVSSPIRRKVESKEHSGYIGSIDSYRKMIKRMYDMSHDVPES